MSEESANKPPEAATPEAAAPKPAAPAAPAKPEPPPPEPGEFGTKLQQAGVAVTHLGKDFMGIEMVAVPASDILKTAEYLRDQCQFDLLVSCSSVDNKTSRQSVYHVYSLDSNKTLAVKVDAVVHEDGTEHSPSLCPIWPAADWHERESYDLMGIHYDGHPNLQRILMPIDWIGHPLRKDYKVDDPRLVWNER
jgi:NADH-quinone oxidoreductase subunit C